MHDPGLRRDVVDPRDDRGQRGVQVGDHDGGAAQVVGLAQDVVRRRLRVVGAQDHRLQRRVARLDQVPGPVVVGRQPVGHRGDHGAAAGAEPAGQRTRRQQHPVADLRVADERRVGQGRQLLAVDVDVEQHDARPAAGPGRHAAVPPAQHRATLGRAGRRGGGDRSPGRWGPVGVPVGQARAVSSAGRTERLLNLLCLLVAATRPLTAGEIRSALEAYAASPGGAAFEKQFERDKAELRGIGVPLVVERTEDPATGAVVDGYRVPPQRYRLPELRLEPDEAVALAAAARVWSASAPARAAGAALRRLVAAGALDPAQAETTLDVAVPDDPGARWLEGASAALADRRRLRLTYRRAGQAAARPREVEPWRLVHWRARWYLVGWAVDREQVRAFRLDRVEALAAVDRPGRTARPAAAEPPDGFDAVAAVAATALGQGASTAVLRVAAGRAQDLRREARLPDGGPVGPDDEVVHLSYGERSAVVAALASHAGDVEVLEPAELRADVAAHLRAALEAWS